MKDYAKLAVVALVASVLTAFAMRATQEPQVVHAAPPSDMLPPIFKKDAKIVAAEGQSSASSATGKVVSIYGTWVEFTDGSENWWVDMNRTSVYYQTK